MSSLVDLYEKLVKIDSPSGEEENLSRFVEYYLHTLGIQVKKDKYNQIFCSVGSNPNKIFSSHFDTVEPGRNINLVIKDGYIKSDGTTIIGGDNKVSLCCILTALTEHIQEKRDINFELLFTVREETNSGIKKFNTEEIESNFGFVFDCGNGKLSKIVKKSAYIYDFNLSIEGIATHASTPELGRNVLDAFKIILNEIKFGRVDKNTTFNIGILKGGEATNIVPRKLILKGDIRSMEKEALDTKIDHLKQIIKSIEHTTQCNIIFDLMPYSEGYNLDLNSPTYSKIKDLYLQYDLRLMPISTNSGSDANFLNSIGITTYCLGDGVEFPHTVNERIEISKFFKLKDIIKDLMLL